MGGGHWITDSWEAANAARRAAGYRSAFAHTEDILHGRTAARVHERLDPMSANRRGAHTGLNIREALDSDEHPNATPIAVLFDVTGSMGNIPRVLQTKLPQLHGLLQRKGYVERPADPLRRRSATRTGTAARCRSGSSSRTTRWTTSSPTSCSRAAAAAADRRATSSPRTSWPATRTSTASGGGRRRATCSSSATSGSTSASRAKQVRAIIGGPSAELRRDITTARLFTELREKFEVFFLFAAQGAYTEAAVLDGPGGWRELLGQNALVLEDAEAVCETIALALGVMEGKVGIEDGIEDLRDAGATAQAARAAGRGARSRRGRRGTARPP